MQRRFSSFSFGKSSPTKKEETSSPKTNSPASKNLTKNKGFIETKKSFISLQKETKFTKETLEELASGFYTAHPGFNPIF
jgi:hypothetical protein